MGHILTLWTHDLGLAAAADHAGVDRIGLDLEILGKAERQTNRPTWLSPHRIDQLPQLASLLRTADLFVRCNGYHDDSATELEEIMLHAPKIVMLPNVTSLNSVQRVMALIAGRARLVPMIERASAIDIIADLPGLGIEEIHVGLNDLSIDLGIPNRLSLLGLPIMDDIALSARKSGLKLGLGGIGRPWDTSLPVASEHVYAQLGRLNAHGSLLSRSFFRDCPPGYDWLGPAVDQARSRLAYWSTTTASEHEQARLELISSAVEAI